MEFAYAEISVSGCESTEWRWSHAFIRL